MLPNEDQNPHFTSRQRLQGEEFQLRSGFRWGVKLIVMLRVRVGGWGMFYASVGVCVCVFFIRHQVVLGSTDWHKSSWFTCSLLNGIWGWCWSHELVPFRCVLLLTLLDTAPSRCTGKGIYLSQLGSNSHALQRCYNDLTDTNSIWHLSLQPHKTAISRTLPLLHGTFHLLKQHQSGSASIFSNQPVSV